MPPKKTSSKPLLSSLEIEDWRLTRLWKSLEGKRSGDGPVVRNELSTILPKIQTVLRSAGSAPTNFTLHDAGHAFRVAERMAEIVPETTRRALTAYELALLLLSAYLHDIGMSPEQQNVNCHFEYLLTGNADLLIAVQAQKFQEFLDNSKYRLVPPLIRDTPTPHVLRLAREVTAAYCRERHNDWSEDWIRKHLKEMKLGSYTGAVHDLVALCRSHHEGYAELASDAYDARITGKEGLVVNLRYLAVVLRIADVLEFDPERTPDVILRHREIPAENLIYWYKDHEIALKLDANRVVLSARPSSAAIEHAIRQMISQIDEELTLCSRLADEKHFEICPGLRRPTRHVWELLPRSHYHIEKGGIYEYIDGAFRPDTNKLLELLSGVQLYGSPLEAVRELAQNAFDAVRVDMAYARLASSSPNDPELLRSLTTLHRVSLRLDITSEGACLTCDDTGVGMTKNIIGNRFLISGSGKKHDMLALERRADKAGFRVASTGQFGIGVLSYFMICDRLQITTRRATHADNDQEPCGWTFEIEGLSSFGELRRSPTTRTGTVVRLFIKNELVQTDLTRLYGSIREYLVRRLHWLPCKFSLSSTVPGCEPLELTAGWAEPNSSRTNWILGQCVSGEDNEVPLLGKVEQSQKAAEEAHWGEIRQEMNTSLEWLKEEGELPAGLGIYRIAIPYFRILGERLLGFFSARPTESNAIEIRRVGKGECLLPEGRTRVSWKGFIPMVARAPGEKHRSIVWEGGSLMFPWEKHPQIRRSAFCDISLESNESGEISVNRQHLNFSNKTRSALKFVSNKIDNLEIQLVRESKGKDFEMINARFAGSGYVVKNAKIKWPTTVVTKDGEHEELVEHEFPIIVQAHRPPPTLHYRLNGENVSTLSFLPLHSRKSYYHIALSCFREAFPPDKVVCHPFVANKLDIEPRFREHYLKQNAFPPTFCPFDTGVIGHEGELWNVSAGLIPVWTRTGGILNPRNNWGILTSFPPEWRHLCGAYFESCFGSGESAWLWNEANPIVRRVDSESWDWVSRRFPNDKANPLNCRAELLSHASVAAAWVLICLRNSAHEVWDALKDNDPRFLPSVWDLVLGDAAVESEIYQWSQSSTDVKLRVLTSSSWQALRSFSPKRETVRRLLPVVSGEWRIELDTVDQKSNSD